ncbi:adenylylsulfate kinase [Alloalcanivorax xenomutans]|uniref:adenylyl-sulfate kinase n=1 Tax=Alloalcanivorax xenomutans TaxID=1094342 RepID=UPI000BD2D747|nr:adenylyl-sulfate kinase [Alloalcanivorax xenomutans]SOC02037.1 adenylylsulfate kinase [Alloalcanivorax xenomutans]
MSDSPYQKREHDAKAEVIWHQSNLTKADRAKAKGQTPKCIWLTGLSGSGKSTLANALEVALTQQGKHTYLLDGDNVRHGLNKNLGMSDEDRTENIRRVSEVAKLMVDAGLVVVTAFISPFRADRDAARELFEDGEFVEVFVDAPLEECEKRDPKGLYQKARQGIIKEFTGIDSPYEAPEKPEVVINTAENDIETCVKQLIEGIGV